MELIVFLITAALGQEIEATQADLLIAQQRISQLEQTINTLQATAVEKPSK